MVTGIFSKKPMAAMAVSSGKATVLRQSTKSSMINRYNHGLSGAWDDGQADDFIASFAVQFCSFSISFMDSSVYCIRGIAMQKVGCAGFSKWSQNLFQLFTGPTMDSIIPCSSRNSAR